MSGICTTQKLGPSTSQPSLQGASASRTWCRQALLMLATAETGTSLPGKKKLDAMCRASLVQMAFEEMNDGATRDEG